MNWSICVDEVGEWLGGCGVKVTSLGGHQM